MRRLLICFPVPTAWQLLAVLAALQRLITDVPWAADFLPDDVLDEVARLYPGDQHKSSNPRAFTATELREALAATSPYGLAGAVVGFDEGLGLSESAEALRVVLVACQWKWMLAGKPRLTAIKTLASAIRGLTRSEIDPDLIEGVGKATTLPEFISAASRLKTCNNKTLASAWQRHFEPALREVAQPPQSSTSAPVANSNVKTPALPTNSRVTRKSRLQTQQSALTDTSVDRLYRSVRSGTAPRPRRAQAPQPGEAADEVSPSILTAALPKMQTNGDAERVLRYQVSQAVWTRNQHLLPNHPDALALPRHAHAVGTMVDMLRDPSLDQPLHYGVLALLLQALLGGVPRTLRAIEVLENSSDPHDPNRLELLLDQDAFRLSAFWQHAKGAPSQGFQPRVDQRAHLHTVGSCFLLPLAPTFMSLMKTHVGLLRTLPTTELAVTEDRLRQAARRVSTVAGFSFTPGQLRSSVASHLFEICRDVAAVQLICTDTLGQSVSPLFYFATKARHLAQIHWSFQTALLDTDDPLPSYPLGDSRVGSQLLVRNDRIQKMARAPARIVHYGIARLIGEGRTAELHMAMVNHMAGMLVAACTHRPGESLLQMTLADIWLEAGVGAAVFRDKVHDAAHNPRLVALPEMVCRQMQEYLDHLTGLAAHIPALRTHVARVLAGHAPLLFGISDQGGAVDLTYQEWKRGMPPIWQELPMNWGRHWLRTHAIEQQISPEHVNMQMGHLEAVGYPFSGWSPTIPWMFVEKVAKAWQALVEAQGWMVIKGMPSTTDVSTRILPPLRRWDRHIDRHMALQAGVARQWRQAMQARLAVNRRTADRAVLNHPELVAEGIIDRYQDRRRPLHRHSLTLDDFVRIRDEMFDQAEGDIALGIALADAVCRVAKVVNNRTGQVDATPGKRIMLRRPVDNAFVPQMMTAVRQIHALREHIAETSRPAWVQKNASMNSLYARTVLALVLYGSCEHPDQIFGALARRTKLERFHRLEDTILVPYGDEQHEVLGLRGVAATVFAALARRHPDGNVPDPTAIERELAALLPEWALGTSSPTGGDRLHKLCQTAGVANRYELAPAARRANALVGGSTSASIREQLALIDGDPAGTVERPWERDSQPGSNGFRSGSTQTRKGNARAQYRKLCATFPSVEKDTRLPLTQQVIPSGDAASGNNRALIVAEIEAQISADTPELRLHPIVRMLAGWTADMLVHGTARLSKPALSTVKTYLTRIAGALVEYFGHSSMTAVTEADLEEAYLTAIECQSKSRSQAAAAIWAFHTYSQAHQGLPEVDLSCVKQHLANDPQALSDARLILPAERQAVVDLTSTQASNPPAELDQDGVRALRLASQAISVIAWSGLRRNEALGIQFRDVDLVGSKVRIHVRRNRSRGLKTVNARRFVELPLKRTKTGGPSWPDWLAIDRERLGSRGRGTAFIFTESAHPFAASARSQIAEIAVEACRKVTGRSNPRLHAFRHLAAMEETVGLFLAQVDRDAINLSMDLTLSPTQRGPLALPRDGQGAVVVLGHGSLSTSIQSYNHIPWLLRSHTDQRNSARYANRRTLAALMGVSPYTVDHATKRFPRSCKSVSCLEVQKTRRPDPRSKLARRDLSLSSPEQELHSDRPVQKWTARKLSELLESVAQGLSLENALQVLGGIPCDASDMRTRLLTMERRLGRRLLEDTTAHSTRPRATVRTTAPALPFAQLLDWYDDDTHGLREPLALLSEELYEHMHPLPAHRLYLPQEQADVLCKVLGQLGIPGLWPVLAPTDAGLVEVTIPRTTHEMARRPRPGSYLGLPLKRVLLVIRYVARYT